MELAGRLQFSRAIGAARHVLLQFVTSVVRQLVIDMKQNIFLNPFAFHSFTPSQGRLCGRTLLSVAFDFLLRCVLDGRDARPSINFSSHVRQRATQFLGGPE